MSPFPHPIRTALVALLALGVIAPAAASARPNLDPAADLNPPAVSVPQTPQPPVQVVRVSAPGGFDWGDAAIGAAGALGLAMLAIGSGLAISAMKHRTPGPSGAGHGATALQEAAGDLGQGPDARPLRHRRTVLVRRMTGVTRSRGVWALLVVALGSAAYAGSVMATSTGVTTTILGKSTFDQFDVRGHTIPASLWRARIKAHGLSDVYVVDNKLAQGGTTGWHSHPGPSLILVVAGTVTNYTGDDPTCTGHAYPAGSGFIDPGGSDVHTLRNETAAAAETIAVQLLPKDAPRKTDLPPPGNCPF